MVGGSHSRTSFRRLSHLLQPASGSIIAGPSRLPAASFCPCDTSLASADTFARARVSVAPIRRFASAACRSQDDLFAARSGEDKFDGSEFAHEQHQSNVLIMGEAGGGTPTLEHLDLLKPKRRRPRQHPFDHQVVSPFSKSKQQPSNEEKEWEKTKSLVMASFTRVQLVQLAREAEIRADYKRIRKETLVRRLMVSRFGMVDAQEQKKLARERALDWSLEFLSFQPAELFLLLSKGSDMVREAARSARVSILSQAPTDGQQTESPALGFHIRGRKAGTAQMTQWAASFKQTIQTRREELTLLNSTNELAAGSNASHYVPIELSQAISRLSRCFLEVGSVDNGKLSFSLAYIDPQDADRAILMLRQVQSGILQPADNVGAVAYADNLDVLRQYSMLPFASKESSSWIKQAVDVLTVSNTDLAFRTCYVSEHDAYSTCATTSLPQMKLIGWQSTGETAFQQPFHHLNTLATERFQDPEPLSAEYRATLGHVLFDGNALSFASDNATEADLVQKLQNPLAAPCPGTWPIEYLTNWTREFRSKWGKEASRFLPTTFFRSQKNIAVDIWLDRQGWGLHAERADESTERIDLTYQHDVADSNTKPKLKISLQAKATAEDGKNKSWKVEDVRWISETEASVMVPERSVDLQLGSRVWNPVSNSVTAQTHAALLPYIQETLNGKTTLAQQTETETEQQNPESTVPASVNSVHSLALPPAELKLDSVGSMMLGKAEKVLVQTYHQRSTGKVANRFEGPKQTEQETEKSVEITSSTDQSSELSGLASSFEQEVNDDTKLAIAASERAASQEVETESKQHASPILVREIVQDSITEDTRESLSVVWHTTPDQSAPSWQSTVDIISSLIDKHDVTIR